MHFQGVVGNRLKTVIIVILVIMVKSEENFEDMYVDRTLQSNGWNSCLIFLTPRILSLGPKASHLGWGVCFSSIARDRHHNRFLPHPFQFIIHQSTYHSSFLIFSWMVVQPLWTLASLQFRDLFTDGMTPWTGDQPVARPLPEHRINAYRHPCLEWDSSARASEDSSCLILLGYRDRQTIIRWCKIQQNGRIAK
jgi:hypothetical protein